MVDVYPLKVAAFPGYNWARVDYFVIGRSNRSKDDPNPTLRHDWKYRFKSGQLDLRDKANCKPRKKKMRIHFPDGGYKEDIRYSLGFVVKYFNRPDPKKRKHLKEIIGKKVKVMGRMKRLQLGLMKRRLAKEKKKALELSKEQRKKVWMQKQEMIKANKERIQELNKKKEEMMLERKKLKEKMRILSEKIMNENMTETSETDSEATEMTEPVMKNKAETSETDSEANEIEELTEPVMKKKVLTKKRAVKSKEMVVTDAQELETVENRSEKMKMMRKQMEIEEGMKCKAEMQKNKVIVREAKALDENEVKQLKYDMMKQMEKEEGIRFLSAMSDSYDVKTKEPAKKIEICEDIYCKDETQEMIAAKKAELMRMKKEMLEERKTLLQKMKVLKAKQKIELQIQRKKNFVQKLLDKQKQRKEMRRLEMENEMGHGDAQELNSQVPVEEVKKRRVPRKRYFIGELAYLDGHFYNTKHTIDLSIIRWHSYKRSKQGVRELWLMIKEDDPFYFHEPQVRDAIFSVVQQAYGLANEFTFNLKYVSNSIKAKKMDSILRKQGETNIRRHQFDDYLFQLTVNQHKLAVLMRQYQCVFCKWDNFMFSELFDHYKRAHSNYHFIPNTCFSRKAIYACYFGEIPAADREVIAKMYTESLPRSKNLTLHLVSDDDDVEDGIESRQQYDSISNEKPFVRPYGINRNRVLYHHKTIPGKEDDYDSDSSDDNQTYNPPDRTWSKHQSQLHDPRYTENEKRMMILWSSYIRTFSNKFHKLKDKKDMIPYLYCFVEEYGHIIIQSGLAPELAALLIGMKLSFKTVKKIEKIMKRKWENPNSQTVRPFDLEDHCIVNAKLNMARVIDYSKTRREDFDPESKEKEWTSGRQVLKAKRTVLKTVDIDPKADMADPKADADNQDANVLIEDVADIEPIEGADPIADMADPRADAENPDSNVPIADVADIEPIEGADPIADMADPRVEAENPKANVADPTADVGDTEANGTGVTKAANAILSLMMNPLLD